MTAINAREGGRADGSVLVIGVGNVHRRDDAVGLVLARRLRTIVDQKAKVQEASGEGAGLLEAWAGAQAVIVLDAVCSGAPPGTVFRFDASVHPIPARFFTYSSHAFSVAEAVELARVLGRLPRALVLHGVEGSDFGAGEGLSPAVEVAMSAVIAAVKQDIVALTDRGGDAHA